MNEPNAKALIIILLETTWKQARNETLKVGKNVLTNKKITKVVCFKCYNHKTMADNN